MRKLFTTASFLLAIGMVMVSCSKKLPTEHSDRTASSESMRMFDPSGSCDLSLGDRVWNDVNGNGLQEAGEPGIPGVEVKLLNPMTKEVLARTKTDAGGFYTFKGLCAGDYEVEVLFKDCPPTKSFAGAHDLDSNLNPALVKLDTKDETIDFGFVCKPEPPKESCAPCDGKVTELTLRYLGSVAAHVVVTPKKGKSKKSNVIFTGAVAPGGEFNLIGSDKKGTLGSEIIVWVNGVQHVKIHTSCSQPIGPGMHFGDFLVVAGRSRNGGLLCPLDTPPGGSRDLCDDFGRPAAIELRYNGDGCGATQHSQDPSKVVCGNFAALPEFARVVATNSSIPGSGNVWFSGIVQRAGVLVIDAANAGQSRLSSNTWVYIYDHTTLVEKIQFHTSCSQPLLAGDRFGSLEVIRFAR